MAHIALGQQNYGELIPQSTIDEVVHTIAERFDPEKIVLFGSYCSGKPNPDSDLDLLVVMSSDQPRNRRASPIRLAFQPLPCPMDILVYTPEEINKWNGTINHIVTVALKTGKTVYERH